MKKHLYLVGYSVLHVANFNVIQLMILNHV